MKKAVDKLKTLLLNRKGGTLVESIVSITILALLLVAVTALTAMSLRIISVSTANATAAQIQLNNAILGTATSINNNNITIKNESFGPGVPRIDISIGIALSTPAPGEGFVYWEVSP
jgi:hypothetical protein